MRRLRPATLTLALGLLAVLSPASAAPPPPGCAGGPPQDAARSLYGKPAEVVRHDTVAGLQTALVLTPEIFPGVRRRLLAAEGLWCDALEGFNAAWRLAGRPSDPASMAEAYASVSAAPFFDGVSVRSRHSPSPGRYLLETHARTNGIVARWTVTVDGGGIRAASWEATGFAVPPLEVAWEGLTALPGASRRVTRDPSGRLRPDTPVVPAMAFPALESVFAEGVAADGFRIRFHHGDTPAGVTFTGPTGVAPLDLMGFVRRVTLENYNEFLTWGLEKRWPYNFGDVYVDDATSLVCLACVFVSETFNIHVSSQVVLLLERLSGYWYPDRDKAFSLVIGHEMFHNFQNAYGRLWEAGAFGAYSEGTARFQETLHSYNEISYQPRSLVYAGDVNGCNGYIPAGVANGPSTHLYDACLFWMTWYPTHGLGGLVRLMEAMHDAVRQRSSSWEQFEYALEASTGQDVTADLTRFAQRILTKSGLSWGPAAGGGPVLNWGGRHLNRWMPPRLAVGGSISARPAAGGMVGAEVTEAGRVFLDGGSPLTKLYEIRGTSPVAERASGDLVAAPGLGERVWLVAIHPGLAVSVTLRYEAP